MRKRTLREALSQTGSAVSPERYEIYLVRAGDVVLYVGQAGNAMNRLRSHIGQNPRSAPSDLGECILANASKSAHWMFEEYTLEDCRDIALDWRKQLWGRTDEDIPLDRDEVEEALIKLYRPPLNKAANPDPNPLPIEFEWRHE